MMNRSSADAPAPKILLVDDKQELLTSLFHLVTLYGYDADQALGGEAAMQALAEDSYDVVLLDLIMPGISGHDILDYAAREKLKCKIIVVSGDSSFSGVKHALHCGAFDFVKKPYEAAELIATMETALRQVRLEYQTEEMEGIKVVRVWSYIAANEGAAKRIIDYITNIAEVIHTAKGDKITAAQMLTRFMFSHSMQYEYISTLSGGERRRLYLLQTLMMAPNFLILDEPTNDLDVQTLSILEDFLESFDGVLLTVSHDRYFLDRTVEHIFAFEGQGVIKQYPGNYSAYRIRQQEIEAQQKAETTRQTRSQPKKSKPQASRVRKLSYNEKRELEMLEEQVMEMEVASSPLD